MGVCLEYVFYFPHACGVSISNNINLVLDKMCVYTIIKHTLLDLVFPAVRTMFFMDGPISLIISQYN